MDITDLIRMYGKKRKSNKAVKKTAKKEKILSPKILHDYQLRAMWRVINNPFWGLLMEMGLGKTIVMLSALAYLKQRNRLGRVIIIAPLRVARMVWAQEAVKWQHTKNLSFSLVLGSEKERKTALNRRADIHVINFENLPWLIGQLDGNWPYDTVIIDESSKLKNSQSLRFKALKVVRPLFKRCYILTGTPRTQSVSDLWSQFFLLDGGQRLGENITAFRRRFLYSEPIRGAAGVQKYSAREGAENEIYELIKDICTSMRTKDYLKLPPLTEITVRVPITDKVQAAYNKFKREKVLELLDGDTTINAVNAAALTGKLKQYANGAIYDADKKVHEVHKLKIEALAEIMDETDGEPVLLFYPYRYDLDRIKKYLRHFKPVHLQKDADFDKWNNGGIKLALGHMQSMGHGLNLQKAPAKNRINIIILSPDWNLDNVLQGITRVHRQGVKVPVYVYKIILEGTIDERILQSNYDKKEGQDGLMDYVREEIDNIIQNDRK